MDLLDLLAQGLEPLSSVDHSENARICMDDSTAEAAAAKGGRITRLQKRARAQLQFACLTALVHLVLARHAGARVPLVFGTVLGRKFPSGCMVGWL